VATLYLPLPIITNLPTWKYKTGEQRRAFYESALKQVKAAPGVVAAGAVSNLPLSSVVTNGGFAIEATRFESHLLGENSSVAIN